MKYILVEETSTIEFQQRVQQKIYEGWTPLGGVHYTPHWYMQAMVKND